MKVYKLNSLNSIEIAKNHVEGNTNMHVTPMVRQIFKNNQEVQPLDAINHIENLNYSIVNANEISYRKITEEEYNAFPKLDKKDNNVIWRAMLENYITSIVFLVFFIAWIMSFKLGNTLIFTGMMLIGLAVFLMFLIPSVKTLKSRHVTRESEVAVGNAAFFYCGIPASSKMSGYFYYIDVAFHDQKKLVRRKSCSEKVFKNLEMDSEVLIYNSRVYAYDKNRKLIV